MTTYPTKILEYDLDVELKNLIKELREVNEDFKKGSEASDKTISERLLEIESGMTSISLDQLETGNFNEVFTYDADGNVTKHEVTGDRVFTVVYTYKEDGSGDLVDSTKTFTDEEDNTIQIEKEYTYDDEGNITHIDTKTTITPAG